MSLFFLTQTIENKYMQTQTKVFFLPKPQTFKLTYKKANGIIGNYIISAPIGANEDSFTAYAMKHGVRTFKKYRVIDIDEL